MNKIISYGLINKNEHLNDAFFKKLARLLFFSQSNTVQDVNMFLEKTNTKTEEEFLEYVSLLEKEINMVKEACLSVDNVRVKVVEKLRDWIDAYDNNNKDIAEYIGYYNLPDDLIDTMFKV